MFEQLTNDNAPNGILSIYKLAGDEVEKRGYTLLDLATLSPFGLKPSTTQVVEGGAEIYNINEEPTDPISGYSLMDVDNCIVMEMRKK